MKNKIKKMNCLRCGHKWIPRKEDVRMCPKCKSPYFDQAKKKITIIEVDSIESGENQIKKMLAVDFNDGDKIKMVLPNGSSEIYTARHDAVFANGDKMDLEDKKVCEKFMTPNDLVGVKIKKIKRRNNNG